MSTTLPIVAAVPNYNMATELAQLLPRLLEQGYAKIFVLDDASTDTSREVVAVHGKNIEFIAGTQNVGAGGNRNRILDALDFEAIIHFIDADTRVETDGLSELVRAAVPDHEFAFITGLAKDRSGRQSVWNYGPRPTLWNEKGALRQYQFGGLLAKDKAAAATFHTRYQGRLQNWPNPLERPVANEIFWGIEQNIVFRSDIFRRYGGFDASMRETEITELSLRMRKDGLKGMFDPSFSVVHTEARVRPYNRQVRKRREGIRLAFQYGIITWLTQK